MALVARAARHVPRAGTLLLCVVALLLGAAPAMAATTRYAVPGGSSSDPNCTSPSDNCSIQKAASDASAGDELVLMHGTYDLGTSGISFSIALNVHGEDGQPAPLITSTSTGSTMTSTSGNGMVFRHLRVENTSTGGSSGSGLTLLGDSTNPPLVENVEARASGNNVGALFLFLGSVTVRDSSAFVSGSASKAILADANVTARNVTGVASGSGYGFYATPPCFLGSCQGNNHSTLRNSIFDGFLADIATRAFTTGSGTCSSTCQSFVDADFSNYDNTNNCGTCSATAPGTLDNQTAAPKLANKDAGDFHELPGSPTIDKGSDSAQNGPNDPDGNPRKLGAAVDIGAFENPNPPAPPSQQQPQPQSTAQQLAQFLGLKLTVLTLKVNGKVTVVPIFCPAFVVGNCVGTIVIQTLNKIVPPKALVEARKKKRKKKLVTLGSGSFSVPAGQTANVNVKLSKAALKLLNKKSTLAAALTINATANGVTKKTSQTVTLKAPKKKKKKK